MRLALSCLVQGSPNSCCRFEGKCLPLRGGLPCNAPGFVDRRPWPPTYSSWGWLQPAPGWLHLQASPTLNEWCCEQAGATGRDMCTSCMHVHWRAPCSRVNSSSKRGRNCRAGGAATNAALPLNASCAISHLVHISLSGSPPLLFGGPSEAHASTRCNGTAPIDAPVACAAAQRMAWALVK